MNTRLVPYAEPNSLDFLLMVRPDQVNGQICAQLAMCSRVWASALASVRSMS